MAGKEFSPFYGTMDITERMKPQQKAQEPLGLSVESQHRFLPENLNNSLDKLVGLYRSYNEKLPDNLRRPEKDFAFLSNFYSSFLMDRNRRASEVATPEYEKAAELGNELMPMTTLQVLCMDGRVKAVHTNGFTAGIGSAIRTPGGSLSEFVRKDGKLVIEPESHFGSLLLDAVKKSDNVAEVFDSHYGCAARTGEEAATGNYPQDSGLLRDVLHKKEMIKATREMLSSRPEIQGKNIAFIQTTFNPVTGYMYMGLERDEALDFAKDHARQKATAEGKNPDRAEKYAQYTKPILAELIKQGIIISTGALIDDPKIRSAFTQQSFAINRQADYVGGALEFWQRIAVLKTELLPHLQDIIKTVYPHLDTSSEPNQKESEERAMLLLTNAFNSFLHNPTHNVLRYMQMNDHDYENEDHYPYGIHNEEGVKVSEGGHPPYDIPMFVIYSGDLENISDRVELASGLVRKNRLEKRIIDRSGNYVDPEEFASAPVPVIIQEFPKNSAGLKTSNLDWNQIENINWSDMPKHWDTMTDHEFAVYLNKKGVDSFQLIDAIQNLRQKMAKLYDPNQKTSSHLRDLYKTIAPIISDQERRTHALIPFVKVGREE